LGWGSVTASPGYQYSQRRRGSRAVLLSGDQVIGGRGKIYFDTRYHHRTFLSFFVGSRTASVGPNPSGAKHSKLDVNGRRTQRKRRRRISGDVGRLYLQRHQNKLRPFGVVHGTWTGRHLCLHADLPRKRALAAGCDYDAGKQLFLHFLERWQLDLRIQ
jgi:hypothetical protein